MKREKFFEVSFEEENMYNTLNFAFSTNMPSSIKLANILHERAIDWYPDSEHPPIVPAGRLAANVITAVAVLRKISPRSSHHRQ